MSTLSTQTKLQASNIIPDFSGIVSLYAFLEQNLRDFDISFSLYEENLA